MRIIQKWMYDNLLTINVEKSKLMVFTSYQNQINTGELRVMIADEEIEKVDSYKYLGIYLQSNLKWNRHIDSIISSSVGLTGALRRLNKCLPTPQLKAIYFAHVHSKLSYLCPIWGNAFHTHKLKELQVLQNRAIRNILTTDYYVKKKNTQQIRNEQGILSVQNMIKFESVLFFHKILHGTVKNNFTIRRRHDVHNYNTRMRDNIDLSRARTDHSLSNVLNVGATIMNGLHQELRYETNLNKFKKRLKLTMV